MATDDEVRAFDNVRDKLAETQADLRAWIAHAEQAEAALRTVLAQFTEKGYPGRECRRTGWIGVGTIAAWRSVLDRPTDTKP